MSTEHRHICLQVYFIEGFNLVLDIDKFDYKYILFRDSNVGVSTEHRHVCSQVYFIMIEASNTLNFEIPYHYA